MYGSGASSGGRRRASTGPIPERRAQQSMSRQLHLDIRLRDDLSFGNYLIARNREPVAGLQAVLSRLRHHPPDPGADRSLFFWGERGSGKTHLLQAACRLLEQSTNVSFAYVPLAMAQEVSPALLEGLEGIDLVCIDDIEHICGHLPWENALFALVERLRGAKGVLLAAGRTNPASLDLSLPDLATRLGWGLVYQLQALSDSEIVEALQLRAHNRGLQMSEKVARYVLHHYPRDARSVFDFLEQIDETSLARQRRVTIPFIRSLGMR
jgi:DnaA-homolog protein